MEKHYRKIVDASNKAVKNTLSNIILDENSNYYGAISADNGLCETITAIGHFLSLTAAYFCEDSLYYKNEEVFNAMNLLVDFVKRFQRPDGTLDFLQSNFFAAPGFETHSYGRAYKIVEKYAETEKELEFKAKAYDGLKRIARGLYNGGFHTPNHRWVDTAGLLMSYNITGEEYLKEKALKYLAEGIDIDENGEFTERSPGMYNAVNDNALMIIAQEFDKPELYEHVKKNMDLLFHYLEPDGSIFTQNSARKDKGEGEPGKAFYPARYYHIYLKAAYLFNNKKYAKFADYIITEAVKGGRGIPNTLWLYMIDSNLKDFSMDFEEFPVNYEVFYDPSNIVRKRKDDFSVSIIGNNANFMFVQKGKLRCYARLCTSFFAVGQFKPEKIIKTEQGYRMKFNAHGRYLLPFEKPPKTSEWHKMDHSKRKTTNHVDVDYIVDIITLDDGVTLNIKTEGCDRVPLKVEFCFTGGSNIKGNNFFIKGTPGESMILGDGNIEASNGVDKITVGPGFMKHHYAENMRGSVAKSKLDYTVYFTEYTNINKTINIKVGKDK